MICALFMVLACVALGYGAFCNCDTVVETFFPGGGCYAGQQPAEVRAVGSEFFGNGGREVSATVFRSGDGIENALPFGGVGEGDFGALGA